MTVTSRFSFLFLLAFLGLMIGFMPDALARKTRAELAGQVVDAHNLLSDMMAMPDKSIPTEVIARAKAIMFVDRFQAGFIFGIKGGQAVAMLHDGEGNWSPPAFYRVGGGSVGLQIGGERRESILFIMTREGTRMLTGDSGEVGVDAGIAAGPTGANADLSNISETPVLAYTLSSGLYAGATVQGGVFSPSATNNELFYSNPEVSVMDILESRVQMPATAEPLVELLKIYVKDGKEKLGEQ